MDTLPPVAVPLAMPEVVEVPPYGLGVAVSVNGAIIAAGAGVAPPTIPEANMAQVLKWMANIQRPMATLEGRVGTMEVASTDFGTMASWFDRFEELLGQHVLCP
jgi:hypothetical protein